MQPLNASDLYATIASICKYYYDLSIVDEYYTHGFVTIMQNRIRLSHNCSETLANFTQITSAQAYLFNQNLTKESCGGYTKEIDGEPFMENKSFQSCLLDNCLEYYAMDYSNPIEGKLYEYSKYRYGIELYPHNYQNYIDSLRSNDWIDNYTRRNSLTSDCYRVHIYRHRKADIPNGYFLIRDAELTDNPQELAHIIIRIKVAILHSNKASFLVLNSLLTIVSILYIMRSINEIYIGFHFFLNVIIMANNIGVLVNYIIYLIV